MFSLVIIKPKITLVFLGLILFMLLGSNMSASAGSFFGIAAGGTVNITAVVPGPPPAGAPSILAPVNRSTFRTHTITVNGVCEGDYTVRLLKNNIFAGSTACEDGLFSLRIGLLYGRNDLVAHYIDAIGQQGPASQTVTLYLVQPDRPAPGGRDGSWPVLPNPTAPDYAPVTSQPQESPTRSFYITTDYELRGLQPNQPFEWLLALSGGKLPYVVSVDWGDGQERRQYDASSSSLNLKYSYSHPGTYTIKITARDAESNSTFLQLIALVDGEAVDERTVTLPVIHAEVSYLVLALLIICPLLIVALLLLLRYEMGVLAHVRKLKTRRKTRRKTSRYSRRPK